MECPGTEMGKLAPSELDRRMDAMLAEGQEYFMVESVEIGLLESFGNRHAENKVF